MRTGDHPGHGRIVFDWAAAPAYQVEQQGDRVILRFPSADAIDLAGARRLPRNILAVTKVAGGIELTLRPGSRIRHFRNGPKVALDALDPTETREAEAPRPPAERSRPAREVAARPAPGQTPAIAPPRAEAARAEPTAQATARPEVARLEPPRGEAPRVEAPRVEAPRV
ncbi:hypothetical protein KTR66_08240, partial [Roseococcus sp. SDR]|nr:hypothetical protein [Roseococcus sp. SDR]MBV1845294.1 hypothetical protein [Roseococcus sp. SDR]